MKQTVLIRRKRRKTRIRHSLGVQKGKTRLSVFKSKRFLYAQLIDDVKGQTIAAASDALYQKEIGKKATKTERATFVGTRIAELAKKHNVQNIIFDRNGYRYHGRVKALADAVRAGGGKL